MKILFFTAFFYPHKGGVEQYVFEMARRSYQRNIEVSVVACNTEQCPQTEIIEGITIYRLDCWNLLNGWYPIPKASYKNLSLIRKLFSQHYNIANGHIRFYVTTLIGFLFAKGCKIHYIHTEHGAVHPVFSIPPLRLFAQIYDHTIGRLIISRSEKVFAVSTATGRFAQHLGAKGFHIVYNGVDASFFKKINNLTKYKKQKRYLITFIGRLIYAKGVQDIIEVIKEFGIIYNINLLIVGDGDYRSTLEALAFGQANIEFVGEKEREEIREILNATDILVNPSYSEGLPTVVLEAGSCECCVIASDAGGTVEIIDSGVNGLIYPAKDKKKLKEGIEFLLQHKEERVLYGKALRKKVEENFDWDKIHNNFFDLINQINAEQN